MEASTVLTDDSHPGWRVIVPATFSEDAPDGIRIDAPFGHRYASMSQVSGGALVIPGTDTPLPDPWQVVGMEIYLAHF